VLKSDYADAFNNRGMALQALNRFDEAVASYDKALSIKPNLEYAEGDRLHAKLHACDWSNVERECSTLISALRQEAISLNPFVILAIPSSPSDQLKCARHFVAASSPVCPRSLWRGQRYLHDRIRIAYLSADLHDHPTAFLLAGMFEQHDKTRFETTAISFGPDYDSQTRRRLRDSFDRFVDARLQSDQDIAELVRKLEIDIAVDLKGLTRDARTNVFAKRAAPVQVNYLGYPATMGAEYIDYIIADRFVIPEDHHQFYSEQIVYLPESYQANDAKRRIGDNTPSRVEAKLPQEGFIFCSFNNSYKITPDVFDVWMRLLGGIDGSVLWLLEGNSAVRTNLHQEAAKRGVSPERLIFAPRLKVDAHLARHRLADLFLDTLPYNAHTTAADALWTGLPVLTCAGSTFAGRVAGSLLNAVGLPELITQSLQEYETLALKLARDPVLLASLREKLRRHRDSYPLFDTERLTRHIEAAYFTMWERFQRGEPPKSFAVTPK
jgi:protein O-GlcNAc transferase